MAVSSETGRYTTEAQATNGITEPTRKWFSLHNNNLGGTFHPLPANLSEEIGWWGTTLSDASGNLSPAPVLGFTHDSRPVHTLRIVGDNKLSEYPVNFTVRLYGAGDALLHTEVVTGNSSITWTKALAQTVQNVVKVTVTISKISRAGSVAKIVEGLNPFTIYRADSVTVGSAEAGSIAYSDIMVFSSDTLLVKTAEQSTPARATLPIRSDNVTLTAGENITGTTVTLPTGADTAATKIAEAGSITVQTARSDAAAVLVAETRAISATLPVGTDAATVATTEVSIPVIAGLASSDAATVGMAETAAVEARLPARTDTAAPAVAEAASITVTLLSSDSLALTATESQTINVTLATGTDTASVSSMESSVAVTVGLTASDAVSVGSGESGVIGVTLQSRTDTLTIAAPEGQSITAALSSSDTVAPETTETGSVSVTLPVSADVLTIAAGVEDGVTVELASSDSLSINAEVEPDDVLVVLPTRTDTITLASQESRIIIAGMVRADELSAATSDSSKSLKAGRYTSFEQAKNDMSLPARKWFSLHNNTLDGTYCPLPVDFSEQVGWWGTVLSGAGGELSPAERLLLDYNPRPVHTLRIAGDTYLDDYPVDFVLKVYDAAGQLLHTEEVTGNDQAVWRKKITPAIDGGARVELIISRISHAGRVAKIVEGMTPLGVVSSDILGATITEARVVTAMLPVRADAATATISEKTVITVQAASSDATGISVTEVGGAVFARLASSDNLLLAGSEYQAVAAIIPTRADELKAVTTEAVGVTTAYLTSSDVLAVGVMESGAVEASLPVRADAALVVTAEGTPTLTLLIPGSDGMALGMVENRDVRAHLPVQMDAASITTTEIGNVVGIELGTGDEARVLTTDSGTIEAQIPARPDTAVITASEAANVTVILSSSDILNLSSVASCAITAALPVGVDQLILAAGVEDGIIVEIATTDNLIISAAVDSDSVQVKLPVRLDTVTAGLAESATLTAELAKEDLLKPVVTENGVVVASGRYTSVEQAKNSVAVSTRKWFSLHENVLDGSYHPLPADYSEQVGWWGVTLSDQGSSLTPPARLVLDYEPRPVMMLRIAGDGKLGCYPVDFEFRVLSAGRELLHTETVEGNDRPVWTKRLDIPLENAARVELTITRISKGGSVAKIVEAMTPLGIVAEDSLGLSIVDAGQATVHVTAEDVLTVAAAEVQDGIVVKLPQAADTLVARTEESAAITVQIRSSDALAALVAEVAGSVTVLLASQDVLTVAVGDAAGVMAHLASTDAISIAAADVGVVTAELPVRSDVLTLQAAEAGDITAVLPVAVDHVTIAAAETSAVVSALDSSDELIIVAPAGVPAITAELWATDPLTIVLSEERHVTAGLQAADSLTVTAAEAGQITALISSLVDILIQTSEETAPVEAKITSTETITITLADGTAIHVTLPTRTDTISLAAEDAQAILALLPVVTDTLLISALVEDVIWLELNSADSLGLTAEVVTDLWNIHKLMDASVRRVYGRVEINYTDPFLDESIEVTATETGRHTDPAAGANMFTTAKHKWLSLHYNSLDGSFHPLPAADPSRVGWWSAALSDLNGEFAVPPKLTVTFEPRPIDSLKVFGDDKLQEYPVDFTIRLYDAIDVLLLEEVVTGNDSISWAKEIDEIADVTKMELEIQKINRPGAVAKVLEFFSVLSEIYEGDDIMSINLLEETESLGGTLPIGNVSANELSVTLYNRDKKFSPGNPESRLNGLLKKNRRICAWLGGEVVKGEIEWHPLGTFWTQDWNAPAGELWAKTYAWDRLELLRGADFNTSEVYVNKRLYWLAEAILQDAGLKPDHYEIDDSLYDITIPYAWFGRISYREALRKIAAALPGRVYCNRDGKVVIEPYQAPEATTFNFTEDNTFNRDHPLAWSEIANYVTVKAVPRKPGPEEIVYQDIEEIEIGPGEQASRTYLYLEPPVTDAQPPVITAGPDITMVSYTPYAFGMTVVFRNNGTATQSITQVDINGKYLHPTGLKVAVAQDARSIRDNGRIALPVIESEFIQTASRAQEIADLLLATYKDPRKDIKLRARGNIALKLGERVVAPEFSDAITGDYTVKRQELEWDGGLRAYVDGRKIAG